MGFFVDESRPRILFMRHPQSLSNVNNVYSGVRDVGLSDEGYIQRDAAIQGLIEWSPKRIISSPLKRCTEIALPVSKHFGLECEREDRLMELNFGLLEGKTFEEAQSLGLAFPWGDSSDEWPIQDAESIENFNKRISAALDDLKKSKVNTAVICHGGVIRAIFAQIFKVNQNDAWHLMVDNVDSFIFSIMDDNYYLESGGIKPDSLIHYR